MLSQVSEICDAPLDAVIAPLNGGGLLSGLCTTIKALQPGCKIFAVEPAGKNLEKHLRSGKRGWTRPYQYLDTMAEGIKGGPVGELTFPIMCEYLDPDVITVSDEEMIEGMRLVFENLKLVIEMSSGAGVAGAMKIKKTHPELKRVGVVLTGGNVSLQHLARLMELGK